MKTIQSELETHFNQALLPFGTDLPAEITRSTQEKFGHYQCNSAMKLAKALKKKSAPSSRRDCKKSKCS